MHVNSKLLLGSFIAISLISCVLVFWGQSTRPMLATVRSRRSLFPIHRLMQHLHHQARWQELKRSEWPVILWAANARKIPTAVLGSAGPVYRQPIATIRDLNFRFKLARKLFPSAPPIGFTLRIAFPTVGHAFLNSRP
jgi:hypothetical protein